MNDRDPMKRCGQCNQTKLREENFPPDKRKRDGFRGVCFSCAAKPTDSRSNPINQKTRQKMCSTKVRYASWDHAIETAFKGKSHAVEQVAKLRIYECPICKGWHLTKKEKR